MKNNLKKTIGLNLIFLAIGIGALSFNFYAAPVAENPVLLTVIKQGIEQIHYAPKKLDDDFSKKVFSIYLKRLDSQKKFLTQKEVDQLKKFDSKIDDQINDASYEFFDLSYDLLSKAIARAKTYYPAILETPIDFTKNESIETDGNKLLFAKDTVALKEQWRLYIKYQVMLQISTKMDAQAKALENKDTSYKEMTAAEIQEDAAKKVKKNLGDFFERMQDLDKDDWLSVFVNCVTTYQDPHTEYFPPADKENFDIQMSGQLQGIGAQLQQSDDNIKVTRIVPGSPSWREGRLKAGDIILKVAQGNEEAVDVVGMKLDKAVSLIRGKKGTQVRLTVKKADGSIIEIVLIRDVVILEETYAQSLLVKKDDYAFGYIRLPEFYADFSGNGGRSSAADVKKELLKLKDENVKGIILDLRFNGGGSLDDAVQMGGLFIKSGPIVQVKSKTGNPQLLSDKDPNIVYDGPLVILVNEGSASASEILAAAIQDYKRGVIMGSPTTFGKGSVQRMYDLDQLIGSQNTGDPLGSLKVTMQKFYRVSGASTQLKGVTPDIVVPDIDAYLKYGEKEEDFPMPWDEIASANYTPWSGKWNLGNWVTKSNQRVSASDYFSTINTIAMHLKTESEATMETLNLEKFREEQIVKKSENKKIEDLQKNVTKLDVMNLPFDMPNIKSDSSKIARNDDFISNIKKDFYLNEAVNVLSDMNK